MVVPEENRNMFNNIAGGYDRTNDLITLGRHKSWYRLMVKMSGLNTGAKVLDCATGTGNVAIEFKKHFREGIEVTGIDAAENMLKIAEEKTNSLNLEIKYLHGDILNLPFQDNTFDLTTISFGIRNTSSIEKCLEEMARVVKSGGRVMVLETGRIPGLKQGMFKIYQNIVVRNLGTVLTGNKNAYEYFIDSSNEFPSGGEFTSIMKSTNRFSEIDYRKRMFGTIFLYLGIVK